MSDPIYCIHCGNPFFSTNSWTPSNYGKAKVYYECVSCNEVVTLEIITLRMEPDWTRLMERRMDGL